MSETTADLDASVRELVVLYRQAVRTGSGDAAGSAALSLGRALDAVQRARRSVHPEAACELAAADIADARTAMSRLGVSTGTRR
jgi:hypothetical protein